MKFKARTTAPVKTNKNWYSKSNPFYPSYVDNCTWYAWGRELELETDISKKNMPTSSAENWYNETKYPKFNYARVGDIGCYICGKPHKAADGSGHVFVVEEVFNDGRIRISESGVNMKFKTRIIKPPYKYYLSSKYKYTFQGFIHLKDYDKEEEWQLGDYKVLYNKYLRTSPKVKATNKYKWKYLNPNAKVKCIKDKLGYAKYKIGANINIKEFRQDNKGNLWGRTNTLWVCVRDKSGNQVEKI